MRATLALIAMTALSAGLQAQVQRNATQMWDQTTEFTSRGGNGGQANSVVSMAFQYGYIANLKTLTQAQYVMQDQNLATQESWDVGTTGLNNKALPEYEDANGANKIRFYATNLQLPVGTGIGAYLITMTGLGSNPHKITENECQQWHHCWRLQDQANWTSDGISVHMSQAATYNGSRLCTGSAHREIPRVDKTGTQQDSQLGWTKVQNNPDPTFNDRTWRLILNFQEVVLKGFSDNTAWNASPCPNPNPGLASVDPNFNDYQGQQPARNDNPVWEVRAGSGFGGGIAVLFWSQTVFPGGGVPTPFGQLHLNLADGLFAFGPQAMPQLSGSGVSRLTVDLGPKVIRDAAAQLGTWSAQAVVINPNPLDIQLSSLWTMTTIDEPAGWTAGKATVAAPAKITHNSRPGIMFLRNNGRGHLVAQPKRSGNNLGQPTTVCERSCVQITLPAGANEIEVSSPQNANTATNRETTFVYLIQ